jgi:hypothetical protein
MVILSYPPNHADPFLSTQSCWSYQPIHADPIHLTMLIPSYPPTWSYPIHPIMLILSYQPNHADPINPTMLILSYPSNYAHHILSAYLSTSYPIHRTMILSYPPNHDPIRPTKPCRWWLFCLSMYALHILVLPHAGRDFLPLFPDLIPFYVAWTFCRCDPHITESQLQECKWLSPP